MADIKVVSKSPETFVTSDEPLVYSQPASSKHMSCSKRPFIILAMVVLLLIGVLVPSLLLTQKHSVATTSDELLSPLEGPRMLNTDIGIFHGIAKRGGFDSLNATYVTYPGIPFAKPPTGDFRFKLPRAVDPQMFVSGAAINDGKYKKSCWSGTKTYPNKYYGEDCLYLNIYVPGKCERSCNSYPVLVWMHGGGFVAGSTFPEPGKMVTEGQVIVVTVNYRLGIFGFLTTNDADLPANNGLYDQYLAIKWVKDYIKHFKGNGNSIAIFGESAGSVSVALHLISPVSGLHFQKAILQSGAMTSLLSRSYKQRAHQFADHVGCSSEKESSQELAKCLRNVSVADILKYTRPESYDLSPGQAQIDFVWGPVVDGTFIPDEPMKLIKNNTYLRTVGAFDKDCILGVVNDEGAFMTDNFYHPLALGKLANSTFFEEIVKFSLEGRYNMPAGTTLNSIIQAVTTFYTGRSDRTSTPQPINVLDFAGDAALLIPTMEAALAISSLKQEAAHTAHSSSPKVFFYLFDYCPVTDETKAPCFAHAGEFPLEFPRKNITDPVTRKLSDMFIRLLTEFAWTSDPSSAVQCGWPQFNAREQKYLRIDQNPDVRSMLYSYRVHFWLKTLPNLINNER